MDKQQFETLRLSLDALTPTITREVLEEMKHDPELANHFGGNLYEIAAQGTLAFRDVLLGAVEFEHPVLLTNEMNWLEKLLTARKLDPRNIDKFVKVFRSRISSDLSVEQSKPVLDTINQAMQRYEKAR